MKTLIDLCVGLFVVVAAATVIGGAGPALDNYDALKEAQADAVKADQLAAALRKYCGQNGVPVEQANAAYRCYTKLGHPLTATYTPGERP